MNFNSEPANKISLWVAVGITIIGTAFGFGIAFDQLTQLRNDMNLLSQVNTRLAVIDEHIAEMEAHMLSIDQRVTDLQRARNRLNE